MYKKTIIVAFILRLILFISLFILSLLFQSQAKKSPYKNLKRLQKFDLYDSVISSDDLWAIGVTKAKKCKLCKKLKKLLLELSTVSTSSLRHVYKFAWADGYEYVEGIDGDEILFKDQLKIKTFPSIVLFPYGPKQLKASIILDKKEIKDILQIKEYKLRLRKLKTLLKKFLPSKVTILDSAKQKVLRKFTAEEDPNLRRVILFSKSSVVSPMYKKLSLQFDRRYVFGQSSNLKLANKFGLDNISSSSSLFISSRKGKNINVKLKHFTNKTWISATSSLAIPYSKPLSSPSIKILNDNHDINNQSKNALTYERVYNILNSNEEYVNVSKITSKKAWMKNCIKNSKFQGNNNHICIIGIFQFGDQAGGQELEAFQELATRSILRTGYGDGSKGSIQVERMPLSFMWTYGELQDNLMTQFIISRLPCMLIINPNKRYYSIRYGKIPLEIEPMHKFLFASLSGNTKLVKLPKNIDLENDIIEDRKEYASEDDAFDLLIQEEKKRRKKKKTRQSDEL